MSRSRWWPALAFAAVLLASCSSSETLTVDVADLTAPTASGGQIDFGSLEGSDTILWFWAPW